MMSTFNLNVQGTYPPSGQCRKPVGRAFRTLLAAAAFSLGAVLTLGLASGPAYALSVTFNLDREFSGADEPVGGTPWVVGTFDDIAGGVRMTIDTSGLSDVEKLTRWYFNIDEFLTPTSTDFVSGVAASSFDYTEDGHKADGDGDFDALFLYPTSAPGLFTSALTSVYDLLHADLSVSRILALSKGAGNSKDGLYIAAHIQGIGPNDGSGWITGTPTVIPLPPAMLFLLSGLAGMVFLSRRQRHMNGTATA